MEHGWFSSMIFQLPGCWWPGWSPGPIRSFEARDGLARAKARRGLRGWRGTNPWCCGSDIPLMVSCGAIACNAKPATNFLYMGGLWMDPIPNQLLLGAYSKAEGSYTSYHDPETQEESCSWDGIWYVMICAMILTNFMSTWQWLLLDHTLQLRLSSGDPQGLNSTLLCPMVVYFSAMTIFLCFSEDGHGSQDEKPGMDSLMLSMTNFVGPKLCPGASVAPQEVASDMNKLGLDATASAMAGQQPAAFKHGVGHAKSGDLINPNGNLTTEQKGVRRSNMVT